MSIFHSRETDTSALLGITLIRMIDVYSWFHLSSPSIVNLGDRTKDFCVTMKFLEEEHIMFNESGDSCEICNEAVDIVSECKICGARVCSECFIPSQGICLTCNETLCEICHEFLASRACNVCGKLVCEDHGIKRNEATICESCQKEM